MIGKTLGHYKVTERIGAGGMGVVYKARDLHLDRFVALKILPPEKVADPERKRRFVQEAKAASALNHPNIVHVYDIDQSDGTDYIAMEYVDGKTLDQRIGRHGLGLNDALKYAVQIADALAKAHSAGIVHRDLKPTNIMVNEDGVVKVLDFGLAKLTEQIQGDENASTATVDGEGRPITEEGVIVGTVSYMSPEQAEGKKVDARSDIFSLGSVLYEMVTGQKAFQGTSKMSTLSAILHQEPKPVSGITQAIPADFEKLINRCLRKDPERRFQHMDDVRVALLELKEDSQSGRLQAMPSAARQVTHKRLVVVTVAVIVLVAAGWYWLNRQGPGEPEATLTAVPLTTYPGSETNPSFSLDGTQVAFSWNGEAQDNYDIYVKQIGVEPPSRLTTDPAPDARPAWSPDGRTITFLRTLSPDKKAIMLIPQRGGRERLLAEAGNGYLAWTPDSKWLVGSCLETGRQALYLFSIETGEKQRLTYPPELDNAFDNGDRTSAVSPDGHTLAFAREDGYTSSLYLLHLGRDYSPEGQPERVASDNLWNAYPAWMPDSSEIVFESGNYPYPNVGLWRLQSSNSARPRRLAFAQENCNRPAISRQGNRLAYQVEKSDENIWRIDLREPGHKPGVPVPLISSTRVESSPAYSSDGKKIAFVSDRSGTYEVWICDSDGSNPTQLTTMGGLPGMVPKWSPDNQKIVFHAYHGTQSDLYVISPNGGAPRRLTTSPGRNDFACWSPDGRWLYFSTNRGGPLQIWKMPSSGGEAVQITRNPMGGHDPHLSPDGKVLYYSNGFPNPKSVWRMPVEGGEEVKVLDSVHPWANWTVREAGIYFFMAPDKQGHSDLSIYEFASNTIKRILTIERPVNMSIEVSPDGRTVLYVQLDETGRDLMLVENFR